MAATREGRGKRQLLEENDICSTRLGRWSCLRGWPSWYPRHLRDQQPYYCSRKKKFAKITEYRDTAPLTLQVFCENSSAILLKKKKNWQVCSCVGHELSQQSLKSSHQTGHASHFSFCRFMQSAIVSAMGAVRITSLYPNFNGSHFGLPPGSIHKMTGLGGKMVWTMTQAHRPQRQLIGWNCSSRDSLWSLFREYEKLL